MHIRKTIKDCVMAAVMLMSASVATTALTVHTTAEFDAYTDETDATQTLKTVTYNERQYETYVFFKGKDAGNTTVYGFGAVDDLGHFKVFGTSTNSSGLNATGTWYDFNCTKFSGESKTYTGSEFASYLGSQAFATWNGNNATPNYIQLSNRKITLLVTGYDQFSIAIEENIEENKGKAKGRYIKVEINGVEATNIDGYTDDDGKVYRYSLNPDIESTIVISDAVNSTSNQSKVGAYFSLRRIPQVVSSATVVVSGSDVTADQVSVNTVHFLVPYASDITSLTPNFTTITGGTLVGPTTPQNFTNSVTNPIEYTFKYDKDNDGVMEDYLYKVTVEKIPASTVNTLDKLSYNIDGDERYATISGNTVTVTLPYSYSDGKKNAGLRTSIPTTIEYSDDLANAKLGSGATVTEGTAMNIDYTSEISIIVTAENGDAKTYNIKIDYEQASEACDLLTFALPLSGGANAEGVITGDQVNVYMKTSDLASSNPFTPIYTTSPLSEKASTVTIPMDFGGVNKSKIFRINAEKDGVYKDYHINLIIDDDKPTAVLSKPADVSATLLAGPIQITFNEAVKQNGANAGKISIKKKSDNAEAWTGTIEISADGKTGTANFKGLEGLTDYYIEIAGGSITDLAGNEYTNTWDISTADGTLHDLPYCSNMDGANFEQPAFIVGEYDSEVNTRGSKTATKGAYKLAKNQQITLTTDQAGTLSAIIFSYGKFKYSVSDGITTNDYELPVAYDNNGVEATMTVDRASATTFTITNTGDVDIYVPYISVSAVGEAAVTEKDCNCK